MNGPVQTQAEHSSVSLCLCGETTHEAILDRRHPDAHQRRLPERGGDEELKLDLLMNIYPWVDMVMFSELCAYGPHITHAQAVPGEFEQEMCAMAAKYGIWLLPGSIFERAKNAAGEPVVYNTASVIDPGRQRGDALPQDVPLLPLRSRRGGRRRVLRVRRAGRGPLRCEHLLCDMWIPDHAHVGRDGCGNDSPTLTGTIDREIELSIARASAATNQCYFFDINGLDAGAAAAASCAVRKAYRLPGRCERGVHPDRDQPRKTGSRELGVLRLGQPMKSFRDAPDRVQRVHPGLKHPYWKVLVHRSRPTRVQELTDLEVNERRRAHDKSRIVFSFRPPSDPYAI